MFSNVGLIVHAPVLLAAVFPSGGTFINYLLLFTIPSSTWTGQPQACRHSGCRRHLLSLCVMESAAVLPDAEAAEKHRRAHAAFVLPHTMRVQLIGQFKACMTEIYLHIDARMADYMATHP